MVMLRITALTVQGCLCLWAEHTHLHFFSLWQHWAFLSYRSLKVYSGSEDASISPSVSFSSSLKPGRWFTAHCFVNRLSPNLKCSHAYGRNTCRSLTLPACLTAISPMPDMLMTKSHFLTAGIKCISQPWAWTWDQNAGNDRWLLFFFAVSHYVGDSSGMWSFISPIKAFHKWCLCILKSNKCPLLHHHTSTTGFNESSHSGKGVQEGRRGASNWRDLYAVTCGEVRILTLPTEVYQCDDMPQEFVQGSTDSLNLDSCNNYIALYTVEMEAWHCDAYDPLNSRGAWNFYS